MVILRRIAFLASVTLAWPALAADDSNVAWQTGTNPNGTPIWSPVSNANPMPVAATASIAGFAPNSNYGTPLSVTTSTGNVALPSGTVVAVQNVGSAIAYVNLGTSNAVTATTSGIAIQSGETKFLTVGSNTYIAAITGTGSTTLNTAGGTGLGTGSGGGGGSGSSSNASVAATGAAVPASATYIGIISGGNLTGWTGAVTAASLPLPTGAATSALQTTGNTALTTINTTLGTPMQNTGGTVAATESGTWNITNVSGTVSLPTGAATAANQVTTPATGNGATNANTQRVTLSSDSTGTVAATTADGADVALGATADAAATIGSTGTVSAKLRQISAQLATLNTTAGNPIASNAGGTATSIIGCNSSIVYDASTNGATQLVALSSGKIVYVCGYTIIAAGTVNVELDYGTGTACATGNTKMTPAYQLTAQTGVADGAPFYRGMATAASNELCIKTSAGVAVQAVVYYTQF